MTEQQRSQRKKLNIFLSSSQLKTLKFILERADTFIAKYYENSMKNPSKARKIYLL